MTTLQEYLAGTDPTNSASAFKITSVTPSSPGYTVTWQSVAGKQYQVQSTDDMGTPFAVLSGTIAAAGATTSYTDGTASGRRFYKVSLVTP